MFGKITMEFIQQMEHELEELKGFPTTLVTIVENLRRMKEMPISSSFKPKEVHDYIIKVLEKHGNRFFYVENDDNDFVVPVNYI